MNKMIIRWISVWILCAAVLGTVWIAAKQVDLAEPAKEVASTSQIALIVDAEEFSERFGYSAIWHPEDICQTPLSLEEAVEEEEENEYANLAVAHVDHYVNVRSGAGTDFDIVGKMYDGSVAEILDETEGEDGLWFHVESGSVRGYIKSEYFVYGEELLQNIDQYIQKYAVVQVNRLNVRKEPSVESERVSYVTSGDELLIADFLDDWFMVYYNGEKTGYVAAEYVLVQEEYISAKSIEEEQAELAAMREQEERERIAVADTAEDTTYTPTAPNGSYSTNSELRSAIIEYALQFVGNRYVHGGQSLSDGTDCSGFTCYVYRDFGYSISRTPSGQYSSAGRSVSLEEAQPGDIICYGSGSCTHVGLYIGDGQIVHEANSKKGCIVSSLDYMNILEVRNVID